MSGPSFSASFRSTLAFQVCLASTALMLISAPALVLQQVQTLLMAQIPANLLWKSSPVFQAANYLFFLRISTIFICTSLKVHFALNLYSFHYNYWGVFIFFSLLDKKHQTGSTADSPSYSQWYHISSYLHYMFIFNTCWLFNKYLFSILIKGG